MELLLNTYGVAQSMPRKKKELTFQEKMFRIKQTGIPEDVAVSAVDCEWTELETLEELLNAMKIIGKSINIDIITRSKNTIFF